MNCERFRGSLRKSVLTVFSFFPFRQTELNSTRIDSVIMQIGNALVLLLFLSLLLLRSSKIYRMWLLSLDTC